MLCGEIFVFSTCYDVMNDAAKRISENCTCSIIMTDHAEGFWDT